MAGTGGERTPRQRLFGDRMRARRLDLGLTQEEVAHRMGMDRAYVGALETGLRNPTLDTIGRVAVALGCGAAELVEGIERAKGRTRTGRRARGPRRD